MKKSYLLKKKIALLRFRRTHSSFFCVILFFLNYVLNGPLSQYDAESC